MGGKAQRRFSRALSGEPGRLVREASRRLASSAGGAKGMASPAQKPGGSGEPRFCANGPPFREDFRLVFSAYEEAESAWGVQAP